MEKLPDELLRIIVEYKCDRLDAMRLREVSHDWNRALSFLGTPLEYKKKMRKPARESIPRRPLWKNVQAAMDRKCVLCSRPYPSGKFNEVVGVFGHRACIKDRVYSRSEIKCDMGQHTLEKVMNSQIPPIEMYGYFHYDTFWFKPDQDIIRDEYTITHCEDSVCQELLSREQSERRAVVRRHFGDKYERMIELQICQRFICSGQSLKILLSDGRTQQRAMDRSRAMSHIYKCRLNRYLRYEVEDFVDGKIRTWDQFTNLVDQFHRGLLSCQKYSDAPLPQHHVFGRVSRETMDNTVKILVEADDNTPKFRTKEYEPNIVKQLEEMCLDPRLVAYFPGAHKLNRYDLRSTAQRLDYSTLHEIFYPLWKGERHTMSVTQTMNLDFVRVVCRRIGYVFHEQSLTVNVVLKRRNYEIERVDDEWVLVCTSIRESQKRTLTHELDPGHTNKRSRMEVEEKF